MDYDSFASIYDRVCPGIEGDVEFFIQCAQQATKTLEIGYGSGRIYLELRKNNISAVGIDSSKEMLKLLRKKALRQKMQIDIRQQSMLEMQLSEKYDLVILGYRTFMHLYTSLEQREALLKIKDVLDSNLPFFGDESHPEITLFITHGFALRVLEKLLLQLSDEDFRWLANPQNCHLSCFDYNETSGTFAVRKPLPVVPIEKRGKY